MGFFTLETMQAQLSPGGNFSPWVWDLGLKAEAVGADEVRVRLPYNERIARPGGVVIGQAMMALSDSILVLAFCERLGRFATMATISLTTNFLRPAVRQDIIGVARAVKVGRTTAFGEVDIFADGSPDRIAQTIGSFAVLPEGVGGVFKPADARGSR
ncbi:MAG: PaaI family thioesterase [Alphaproteobacteria bacterium]|nr:PaaI family thioesterase [Alphaproteobacteria bacterium]